MDFKEQTPLYIVGLVAIVAVLVLVVTVMQRPTGYAFQWEGVGPGAGESGSASSLLSLLQSLGFTIEGDRIVGDCDDIPGVTCDESSQTATYNGRTYAFGGFNEPRVMQRRSFGDLSDATQDCVEQWFGTVPSNLAFNIPAAIPTDLCDSYATCDQCFAAAMQYTGLGGYQAVGGSGDRPVTSGFRQMPTLR